MTIVVGIMLRKSLRILSSSPIVLKPCDVRVREKGRDGKVT
jgi:hypothetical protein